MIKVDISNIWGELSLTDLLSVEAEISAAHSAVMERTGALGGSLGWLELPDRAPTAEHMRILAAGHRIRENSDVLVVVGIGGAVLGARAAIELLQGKNRNLTAARGEPMILFAGNDLSTRQWNELTRLLEGRDFSLCVISRSGGDLEPAIAFRSLKWMLERRYGTAQARRRIYAVTDGTEGVLRRMADEEGWESFVLPSDVSEGFGVLSPAGLLPMAVAGIDGMALLRGAAAAKREYDLRSFENPVWLYAAIRTLMQRRGKCVELLESFEPGFDQMGRWWQQLFAGCDGTDGRGLLPVYARLPEDLYGLGRLIRQGPRSLFETVLRFDPPVRKAVIGEDFRDSDGLNYLAGRTLAQVEEQAAAAAMTVHSDSGCPVISIECGALNEESLGGLYWFFQLSCAVTAELQQADAAALAGPEEYQATLRALLGGPEA